MSSGVPVLDVPHRGVVTARDLWSRPSAWDAFEAVPFVRAADGAAPVHPTRARMVWDSEALHLRIDCDDACIWATHLRRDAPLWQEEVVEWFVSPGDGDPVAYAELEWNPLGAMFDAWVDNPDSDRATMRVRPEWTAEGLRSAVRVDHVAARWTVLARLPWTALGRTVPPPVLRGNLYRIERPAGGVDEFLAWSPTYATPPDFHRPARFGRMVLSAR